MSRIGGFLPLILRSSLPKRVLRVLADCGSFALGYWLAGSGCFAPWELVLAVLAVGGSVAFLKARLQGRIAIWQLGKRVSFLPSAGLFLVGWLLFRYAGLPSLFFKAGLVVFCVSCVLAVERLEKDLEEGDAIHLIDLAFLSSFSLDFSPGGKRQGMRAFCCLASFLPFPLTPFPFILGILITTVL
jgi:hypothetical protein